MGTNSQRKNRVLLETFTFYRLGGGRGARHMTGLSRTVENYYTAPAPERWMNIQIRSLISLCLCNIIYEGTRVTYLYLYIIVEIRVRLYLYHAVCTHCTPQVICTRGTGAARLERGRIFKVSFIRSIYPSGRVRPTKIAPSKRENNNNK